jgi:hypothetical protein
LRILRNYLHFASAIKSSTLLLQQWKQQLMDCPRDHDGFNSHFPQLVKTLVNTTLDYVFKMNNTEYLIVFSDPNGVAP